MTTPSAVDIDFETYYDDEYTAQKLSTYNYLFDERFDAYLVAIVSDDIEYVGPPAGFDWQQVNGRLWVMHYAGFDTLVIKRLQQDGVIPKEIAPSGYFDTADMAAYLRAPRSLKDAATLLLGVTVDKTVRTAMRGKTYESLDSESRRAVEEYALTDARTGYQLYKKCGDLWPAKERRVSELNILAGINGIPVNRKKAEAAEEHLKTLLWELERQLPWVDPVPGGPPKAKPMSPKAAREQGRIDGIQVPANFDARDPAVAEWEAEYGDKFGWVRARREYGRVNTLLQRVSNLVVNLREDDTLYYQCKYHGAGPGRFSGGGGDERGSRKESGQKFNVQNMPREEMFGVDLRGLMEAPEGFVFGIHDYAQIEARLLLWRCHDDETLRPIREEGMSIYEAYARAKLGWAGGKLKVEDPELYRLAKALVLGAGYQCWANAFQNAAYTLAGLVLPLERCETIIRSYRAANPLVVRYWEEHKKWLRLSIVRKDDTHSVRLASGRVLTYYNPRWGRKDVYGRTSMQAQVVQGKNFITLFGGKLTENEIQATARDILVDAWVAMADEGIRTLFTVHDEFVNLYPVDRAEELSAKAEKLMVTSSPWAAGCPLAVESKLSKTYEK